MVNGFSKRLADGATDPRSFERYVQHRTFADAHGGLGVLVAVVFAWGFLDYQLFYPIWERTFLWRSVVTFIAAMLLVWCHGSQREQTLNKVFALVSFSLNVFLAYLLALTVSQSPLYLMGLGLALLVPAVIIVWHPVNYLVLASTSLIASGIVLTVFGASVQLQQVLWPYGLYLLTCVFLGTILSRQRFGSLAEEYALRTAVEQTKNKLSQALGEKEDLSGDLQHAKEELVQLVKEDGLTGVATKSHLQSIIESEIARSRRYTRPMAVIALDADHLREVNDRCGRLVGDQILKRMAFLIGSVLRATDSVGRWDGQEFVIVLPELDIDAALRVAEKVRQSLAAEWHEPVGNITASFGVADWIAGDTVTTLVRRAQHAATKAKNVGGNTVSR